MRADRKLWLTADRTEVVEDGDPRAAFLFAAPGKEISDADAERYGITEAKPVEEKQADEPADKQAPTPVNKARGSRKRA